MDSPGLAKRLAGAMQSPGAVSFVIGSSHGLSPRVKAAGEGLSMSPMTFPHQLARVMLCEQIYRGFQILGAPNITNKKAGLPWGKVRFSV